MLSDDRVQKITIFFLFAIMDEKIALQAAHRAIAQLKTVADEPGDATTARVLSQTFNAHRKLLPRNRPATMPEAAWRLPSGVDIAAWSKFHRDSSDAEVVALVLSKFLGLNERAIAKGLSVSQGTVRYRVGKAIKHLGAVIGRPEPARA